MSDITVSSARSHRRTGPRLACGRIPREGAPRQYDVD